MLSVINCVILLAWLSDGGDHLTLTVSTGAKSAAGIYPLADRSQLPDYEVPTHFSLFDVLSL